MLREARPNARHLQNLWKRRCAERRRNGDSSRRGSGVDGRERRRKINTDQYFLIPARRWWRKRLTGRRQVDHGIVSLRALFGEPTPLATTYATAAGNRLATAE